MFQETFQVLNSNSIPPDLILDSVFDIETALEILKEVEGKISHFTGLKKHRAAEIDSKVESLKGRYEALRAVIYRTMQKHEPKKTTLDFPSVGRVSKRISKPDWIVNDEDAMLDFLKEQGVKNQVVKSEETVVKSELKKVLDNFEDQKITVPGTKRKAGEPGISVTFEKDDNSLDEEPVKNELKQSPAPAILPPVLQSVSNKHKSKTTLSVTDL